MPPYCLDNLCEGDATGQSTSAADRPATSSCGGSARPRLGVPPDVDPALMAAYVRITGGHSQVLRPGDTLPLRADAGTTAVSARVVAAAGLVEGETPGAPQTRACPAHPPHEARPDDTSDNF